MIVTLSLGWIVSLVSVVLLLGSEVRRIRRGEIPHEMLHHTRKVMSEFFSGIAHKFLRLLAKFVAWSYDGVILPLWRKIRQVSYRVVGRIFGRHARPKGRASSFFLKYIAEERASSAAEEKKNEEV